MQGVPKGLTHRALGITHEQHVLSLPSDGILKIGRRKEEEWNHKTKSMNPSLFQSLKEQRRQEDPCNKGRAKFVHLHSHPTLCLDASLQGGISTGRPLDWRETKVFSQLYEVATYLFKEGTLEGATTMLKIIDGRLGKFLKLTLLSSIHLFALERIDS